MKIWVALIFGVLLSFLIAFLARICYIPWLRKLHFGQTILDIGPAWHKSKQGTPVMGGLMFIISIIVSFAVVLITDKLLGGHILTSGSVVIGDDMKVKIFAGLLMAVAFGLIGFADDYIKVAKKRNLGLTIAQKTGAQILVMLAYLAALYMSGNTYMFIPFVGNVDLKFFLLDIRYCRYLSHGKCRKLHGRRRRLVCKRYLRGGNFIYSGGTYQRFLRCKPSCGLPSRRMSRISYLELVSRKGYDGRYRLNVPRRYGCSPRLCHRLSAYNLALRHNLCSRNVLGCASDMLLQGNAWQTNFQNWRPYTTTLKCAAGTRIRFASCSAALHFLPVSSAYFWRCSAAKRLKMG
mgnify:CR=1 FL=1